MGLFDAKLAEYKPQDNDAEKKCEGDAVAKVNRITKTVSKKNGMEYLILEAEVINPVPPKEGKESNIVAGDTIKNIYAEDGKKGKDMAAFLDDMFTAGIPMDMTSEDAFELSCTDAVNKLIYFRCYKGKFKNDEGEEIIYYRNNVRTKNMITEELSTPQIPF